MATAKHNIAKKNPKKAKFAELKSEKNPPLTKALCDQIEEFMAESHTTRRAGLLYLTRPWKETSKSIEKNRGFAVATANVVFCLEETIDRYENIAKLLESSRARMLAALCSRKDMKAVMRQGEKDVNHG